LPGRIDERIATDDERQFVVRITRANTWHQIGAVARRGFFEIGVVECEARVIRTTN
jgi:hypothetical protein